MKAGDLVQLRSETINYIEDITADSIGIVIHAEAVDHNECMSDECNYLVYVKWAGVEFGILEGKYWIYHDIDLDVVQAA
tara:strand:+ start:4957 stop:5193 length:237 start_codon:yes stop_codon:yes gene_type:complete